MWKDIFPNVVLHSPLQFLHIPVNGLQPQITLVWYDAVTHKFCHLLVSWLS